MNDFLKDYGVVSKRDARALASLFSVYTYSDLVGESICFGYSDWSKFYYIAFENISLSIILDDRDNVMWMTTDLETGNEEFFDTEEEAKNFWNTLHTNFYKFINICTKVSMNIPWCCAPWLPTPNIS